MQYDKDKLKEILAEVFGWRKYIFEEDDVHRFGDAFDECWKRGWCWESPPGFSGPGENYEYELPDFLSIGVLLPAVMEKYSFANGWLWATGNTSDGHTCRLTALAARIARVMEGDETVTEDEFVGDHADPVLAIAAAVLAAEGLEMPLLEEPYDEDLYGPCDQEATP